MRRESGFTLIELLITMTILGLVLAGITQMFTGVLTQFKQQSRIAETSIEGIVGLELLRQDLENAGFGLPWRIPATVAYEEAVATTAYTDFPSNDSPGNPPRAFVAGSGAGWSSMGAANGSDVLIIKATNVARSNAAQNWTYLSSAGIKTWDVAGENLVNTDRVIVIEPGTTDANRRNLARSSIDPYPWRAMFATATAGSFAPSGSGYNLIYGIDPDTDLRMPFNRADYYIVSRTSTTVPTRCAPNTSVFSKKVISHNDGARRDNLPLLDCVADMQVVFRLDRNGDGIITVTDDLSVAPLTAEQTRNQVKEVRVYILAHEGQMDRSYTHPVNDICVGEVVGGVCTGGRLFNIGTNRNYRWKLYTLVVKPKNLR